ncbi:MAG: hypothetical protein WBB01_16090, partial [Phormidesmis sp.]
MLWLTYPPLGLKTVKLTVKTMPLSRSANRLVKGLIVSWLLVTGLSGCGVGRDRRSEVENAASPS